MAHPAYGALLKRNKRFKFSSCYKRKDYMNYTKNVPLALFSVFCLKALFTGLSLETVACLGVLGTVSFLYETFIQNSTLKAFKEQLADLKKDDEFSKKELEQIKAYVSSLKLNGIRSSSGFNRPAQQ